MKILTKEPFLLSFLDIETFSYRVFQAKYFPTSTVFDAAKVSSGPMPAGVVLFKQEGNLRKGHVSTRHHLADILTN